MKENYQQLLELYRNNAPELKKLRQHIYYAEALNRTIESEIKCAINLFDYAILRTDTRKTNYARYFKKDVRTKCASLVLKIMGEATPVENQTKEACNFDICRLGVHFATISENQGINSHGKE